MQHEHDWVFMGGCGCPRHEEHEDMKIGTRRVRTIYGVTDMPLYCCQGVYCCSICGAWDYGDEPGLPAYDHCANECPLDNCQLIEGLRPLAANENYKCG